MPDITALLTALGSEDPGERAAAIANLTRKTATVLPQIAEILAKGSPVAQKAVARLLGRQHANTEIIGLLRETLRTTEIPKLRKNAAIALGKLQAADAVPDLGDVLGREPVEWVRDSLILALGAIGGDRAAAILHDWRARGNADTDALHKALGKIDGRGTLRWRPQAILPDALYEAPEGLEEVAIAEAAAFGLPPLKYLRPGLVAASGPVVAEQSGLGTLRCVYGMRLPLATAGMTEADDLLDLADRLLSDTDALSCWRAWIDSDSGHLPFRLKVEGRKLERRDLLALLERIRRLTAAAGMTDNPSGYAAELILSLGHGKARAFLKPTFHDDTRFAYRRRDVGASINPVVGACLARLAGPARGGAVFDPTCGSATLLVERARLDPEARLIGLDISNTAIAAAKANIQAAGLPARTELRASDARAAQSWPSCALVLANLPFGLRVGRRGGEDLSATYADIATHLADHLLPGGAALLYTANRTALDAALIRQKGRLRIDRSLKCQSGGLWVHIRLVTRIATRTRRGD